MTAALALLLALLPLCSTELQLLELKHEPGGPFARSADAAPPAAAAAAAAAIRNSGWSSSGGRSSFGVGAALDLYQLLQPHDTPATIPTHQHWSNSHGSSTTGQWSSSSGGGGGSSSNGTEAGAQAPETGTATDLAGTDGPALDGRR